MFNPEMPLHPATGLQAIGLTSRGPIWPVLGGSQPSGEPAGQQNSQGDPAPDPKPDDQPLGEGGIKALNAERDARKAAEDSARDLQKQLDALNKQLAAKDSGAPEWEQKFNALQDKLDGEITARQKAEQDAATARLEQLRSDRATATDGFPRSLAKKLTGTTADEIDAEIKEIMADLGPRRPEPNGHQGHTRDGGDAQPSTVAAGAELYSKLHPKAK